MRSSASLSGAIVPPALAESRAETPGRSQSLPSHCALELFVDKHGLLADPRIRTRQVSRSPSLPGPNIGSGTVGLTKEMLRSHSSLGAAAAAAAIFLQFRSRII
jgi:hypothetical protein